jgi:group I intron endonuclease
MEEDRHPTIGVYKISNSLSGRYYIGYSTNIGRRFTTHRRKLKQNCHDNIFLQRAYNLDGEDKFKYDIIHVCDTEVEAKEIELQYLTDLSIRDKLYNLNYNNSGGDLLSNHPEKYAIREKINKSCKETLNKLTSEERKQKYGKVGEKNGMYGKTHTDEVRNLISEVNKGRQSINKGKKASEETKHKMSEAAKLKIGEKSAFYGKHHSEESIQKIKEKNKGRLPPNTTKISIDGIIYISMTEASRQLNIPTPTILWRIKSINTKFSNYKYVKDDIFMLPSETLSEGDVDNCVAQNLPLDNH